MPSRPVRGPPAKLTRPLRCVSLADFQLMSEDSLDEKYANETMAELTPQEIAELECVDLDTYFSGLIMWADPKWVPKLMESHAIAIQRVDARSLGDFFRQSLASFAGRIKVDMRRKWPNDFLTALATYLARQECRRRGLGEDFELD